jgi:hypothetical protein
MSVCSYDGQPLEEVGEGPVVVCPHVGQHQETDQVPCKKNCRLLLERKGKI